MLGEIDEIVLTIELHEGPAVSCTPELLRRGHATRDREKSSAVGRKHRVKDRRLVGKPDPRCRERREEVLRRVVHVERIVVGGRAIPDVREVHAVAAVEPVKIPRDGDRGRDQRDQHWPEVGPHGEQLVPDVRTGAHDRRPRSALGKTGEALRCNELVTPAGRYCQPISCAQARVCDLHGRGRLSREDGVGAEDGNGEGARSALRLDRGMHRSRGRHWMAPMKRNS